jgi:hypothetical protein
MFYKFHLRIYPFNPFPFNMKQIVLTLAAFIIAQLSYSQRNAIVVKTVDELVNYKDPGWKNVKKMIDSATNKVELMSVDSNAAREAIHFLQEAAAPDMPLGAVVYSTGGILIESGWIRILGSGSNRLTRSMAAWNKGKTMDKPGDTGPYLLVADDAMGGFFAINNGGLGSDRGKVYYMAPWSLKWDQMDMSYREFLKFCFEGDLEEFYKPYMTKNWKFDVVLLPGDQCYNYTPPLWSKEGKKFTKSVRKYKLVEEQYAFNMQMRKNFGFETEED